MMHHSGALPHYSNVSVKLVLCSPERCYDASYHPVLVIHDTVFRFMRNSLWAVRPRGSVHAIHFFLPFSFAACRIASICLLAHAFFDRADSLRRKPKFSANVSVRHSRSETMHHGCTHDYMVTFIGNNNVVKPFLRIKKYAPTRFFPFLTRGIFIHPWQRNELTLSVNTPASIVFHGCYHSIPL